jgi:BirA family biotin operon repressor/biotin-[acetyl-CoA-carboxylase] ligase
VVDGSLTSMIDAEKSAAEAGDRARAALEGTRFADVRWVAETGSTNTDALELARQGEAEGVVLVADHQTAGRGRRGRSWQAPPGASLTTTILLRPPAAVAGLTTAAVGLAASAAIEDLTGVVVRSKWPNDLVWPGDGEGPDRKLAGILAEADWPAGSGIADGWRAPRPQDRVVVAVGIGINVAWRGRAPEELTDLAVALDEIVEPQEAPDRVDLLVAMLRRLDDLDRILRGDGGAATLLDRWRQRSATLGRRVRVDLGSDDVEGTAVDVTEEGHLVVETLEGERRTLAVGDVVHLRRA